MRVTSEAGSVQVGETRVARVRRTLPGVRIPLAAAAPVIAALLTACGGDGAAAPPTAGPTPTQAPVSETDTAYARDICGAFGRYITRMGDAQRADPQLFSDQAKLLRAAAPILDTLSKDLDKAKPPKDVANFHDAVVENTKTMATKAKGGLFLTAQELSGVTSGAPLPPITVRARLVEAAGSRPECAQSGGMDAFFGDTGQ